MREGVVGVPRHVAVIMDGNGRWAAQRSLPRHVGHRAGVKSVRATVEGCARRGVGALTLFAFSSENWSRPADEIARAYAHVRRGDRPRSWRSLRQRHPSCGSSATRRGSSPSLSAHARSGDADRARRAHGAQRRDRVRRPLGHGRRRARAGAALHGRELSPDAIDETVMRPSSSSEIRRIRTCSSALGGEHRVSNFLLWNLAYTELYFCDVLWPDFDDD